MMRLVALGAVAAVSVSVLAGCSTVTVTCTDWVPLHSAQEMAGEAALIVVGTESSEAAPSGAVHSIDVSEVVRQADGLHVAPGDVVTATSIPADCKSPEQYPDGDPLDVAGTGEFFLHSVDGGTYTSLTPYAGAVEVPASGELPWRP